MSDVSNMHSRRVVSPRMYVGGDGVQLEVSYVADGGVKWYNHSGKSLALSHHIKYTSFL